MRSSAFERLSAGVRRRRASLAHRGDAVCCPVCDLSFVRFDAPAGSGDSWCWRCGAGRRQRALALFLQRYPGLLANATAVLHLGGGDADRILRPGRAGRPAYRYVRADGAGTPATEDGRGFDAVVCSHDVMATSDARAGAWEQLAHITADGGWCLAVGTDEIAGVLARAGFDAQRFDLQTEFRSDCDRCELGTADSIWLGEPKDAD